MYRKHYDTPIGTICVTENGDAITGLYIENDYDPSEDNETSLLRRACDQLMEYFGGSRREFNLPLELHGTDFQRKVWGALMEIPYGETRTYADIAGEIGNPKVCRAVGGANNKNPIMIFVPCHRVIGANGAMVGFGAGIEVKEFLLGLERR